ncbi:MAG: hypothetical protein ACK5XN_14050, partial [Bacteroidota bacterium]
MEILDVPMLVKSIPEDVTLALKKSKILLFVMVILSLGKAGVPVKQIALEGKLPPAGPMSQFEIVLLSFPVNPDKAPNQILPPAVPTALVLEPKIEQFVIVLFVASVWNKIVHVFINAETVVLEMVKLFPLVLRPSTVT